MGPLGVRLPSVCCHLIRFSRSAPYSDASGEAEHLETSFVRFAGLAVLYVFSCQPLVSRQRACQTNGVEKNDAEGDRWGDVTQLGGKVGIKKKRPAGGRSQVGER